jgi:hypothetical protein
MREFMDAEEGQALMEATVGQLKEQLEQVSASAATRQGYLFDCFREATAFPIVKERSNPAFNLAILHGRSIKKELRRVIWSRMFNIDHFRMAFTKWDR